MTATLYVGDVFQRMAELPDHSFDLIITSPPFLALRSYLPDGHPQKHLEIGSEATPAEFLDTMLALTAEWRRLLAPHGSIAVEIGDTYAGSGGAGGDWSDSPATTKARVNGGSAGGPMRRDTSTGWPLDKSLCGIPTLYTWSLAYGRNLLRAPLSAHELMAEAERLASTDPKISVMELLGRLEAFCWAHEESGPVIEIEPWRIRNLKPWIRTNPPVGALGDKERPATRYVTVATLSSARWFDLDAVRTGTQDPRPRNPSRYGPDRRPDGWGDRNDGEQNPGGAPPLDWWHQTDATIDRVIQDPSSAVEALFAATAPKHITACPTCGGSGTHQITPIVGESSVTGETARNRPTDSTEPERQDSPTPGDHHPADAVIDRVIQERAGQGDRGGKNRVANSSASRGISGGDDGNPDKPRSPGASTIGARGHHIRKALTDAGILPPHPDTLDISPRGYSGAHYAVWPPELVRQLVDEMCPRRVCTQCGEPSRRIVERSERYAAARAAIGDFNQRGDGQGSSGSRSVLSKAAGANMTCAENVTVGWSDCGCWLGPCTCCGLTRTECRTVKNYCCDECHHPDLGDQKWRPGRILDPFSGSGTTLAVATGMGRDAVGIDIDPRNAVLTEQRCGMFLTIDWGDQEPTTELPPPEIVQQVGDAL